MKVKEPPTPHTPVPPPPLPPVPPEGASSAVVPAPRYKECFPASALEAGQGPPGTRRERGACVCPRGALGVTWASPRCPHEAPSPEGKRGGWRTELPQMGGRGLAPLGEDASDPGWTAMGRGGRHCVEPLRREPQEPGCGAHRHTCAGRGGTMVCVRPQGRWRGRGSVCRDVSETMACRALAGGPELRAWPLRQQRPGKNQAPMRCALCVCSRWRAAAGKPRRLRRTRLRCRHRPECGRGGRGAHRLPEHQQQEQGLETKPGGLRPRQGADEGAISHSEADGRGQGGRK